METVPPSADETVLAFPTPLAPVRHVRSTILLGSIEGVRESGRFDDYVGGLTKGHRELLLNLVAGSWVPIDLALAHYASCDALGLPVDAQFANGRKTFDRTRATLLGTMIRMARESGVTPWTVFPYYNRFWERGCDGGAMSVTKLGPKDARLELVQCRLVESRYYKNAFRGLATGVLEFFCQKGYVTEIAGKRPPGAATFRMQWA
jgi:hypothetical protein